MNILYSLLFCYLLLGFSQCTNITAILVQGADDAGAALAGASELDGGADLGLHGTLAELTLVSELLGLVGGELLELLLIGLAEVDGDVLDGGQEEQDVGGAVLSEELATHVLVDDGGDALVAALVLVVADDGLFLCCRTPLFWF